MSTEDYDLFGDEEAEAPTPEPDIKKVRGHVTKLEKELKARDAEIEELRAFKDEYDKAQRSNKLTAVFSELGLPPNVTKFWQMENPDVDPEPAVVGKWAVDNGFAQSDETVLETGFTPTPTPEAQPVMGKRLSRQEWIALTATDPLAAQAAFQKGRVDLSDVRQGLGPDK